METMLKGAAPQAAPADLIKDSDQTKFAKDVLEASRTVPVIVDFWAPWCGPCKQLQPAIEKVVKAANGAVKLVKINIDQNQMLAQQLRIQSIPAVYAFFGGRPVDGFMGAVPESQIKQFVDRLIQAAGGAPRRSRAGDEIAELLEHAKAAVAQNDWDLAARVYSEILGVEPDQCRGARRHGALSRAGRRPRAGQGTARPGRRRRTRPTPTSWPCRPRSTLPRRPRKPARSTISRPRPRPIPRTCRRASTSRMAYWANNQRQEAIDELLAMIKADRKWNEEAARQQLLKFFEALGFADPLAVDGRKRLSTILFS